MPNNQIKFILWGALFASNFIYLAIAFLVMPDSNAESNEFIAFFLGVVGVGVLAMSHIIPKFLLKSIASEAESPIKNQKEQTFFIMGLALNESVAIFALVAKIVGHNNLISAILFALSIIGFISKFPKNNSNPKSKLEP